MGYLPKTLGQYVYLASLNETNPEFATKAKNYVSFQNNNSVDDDHNFILAINNAVNYLKKIADSEAIKEQRAINNYKLKIKKYLNSKEIPENIKNILNQQMQAIDKIDASNVQNNQFKLIAEINIIRQNMNTYLRRLQEIHLASEGIKENKNWYPKKNIEFDMLSILKDYFYNQSKSSTRTTVNINRDKEISKIVRQKFKDNIKGVPTEFLEAFEVGFLISFNYWLDSQNESYNNLKYLDSKKLLEKINEYFNTKDSEIYFTRLINKNNSQLLDVLKDIKNQLHLDYIDDNKYKMLQDILPKFNKNRTEIVRNGETFTKGRVLALINSYEKKIYENEDKRFSFHINMSKHGNFFEIIQTIINTAINVRSNVAADIIAVLGSISITENEQINEQELLQFSKNISEIISTAFDKQDKITIKNLDEYIKNEKDISESIQQQLEQTKKSLKIIDSDLDEFFITHESLKLYSSAEHSLKDNEIFKFHGRKMQILSGLAKLYASSDLSNSMIDKDLLITYLININEATVTNGTNKQPLETYLSIFAGLLMFDDIASMVNDITTSMTVPKETSIKQLHVYNLNGIYLPISVILNELITQITDISLNMQIDINKTAAINIEQDDLKIPAISTLDSWKQLSESTIQSTKLQIILFSGFLNYIDKLFNSFKL